MVEDDVSLCTGLPRSSGGEKEPHPKPVGLHYTLVNGVVMLWMRIAPMRCRVSCCAALRLLRKRLGDPRKVRREGSARARLPGESFSSSLYVFALVE
jgi:hypothetical protein